jgi:hypothetical protein
MLAKGGGGKKQRGEKSPASFDAQGIDKDLAKRACAAASAGGN